MIGTDRNLFDPASAVSGRIKEYGALVAELHIIVFAKKSLGLKEVKLADNIWLYPTNSSSRWFYRGNATRLGKKIVFNNKFVRGLSLITAQDPFECGSVAYKISKGWRIPFELQLHTDPFSTHFSGFLNNIRKRIAQKILPKAANIRVVSEGVKKQLLSTMPDLSGRVEVLPIYVDINRFEEAKISFDLHARYGWKFVILMVCRLTEEKNIPQALKALQLLMTKYPDTGLVIVGSGPLEQTLIKLAKDIGIYRNISLVGWEKNLDSYYKTANIFLQTSLFEGYGMSFIEAGLSNLPIISTPVGVATEFEDGKELYLCPINDPGYLASAIADLIENNQKRENLKINMKNALKSKLLSKDEYLKRLISNWEKTAKQSESFTQ